MSAVNSSRREFVQASLAMAVGAASSALPGLANAQAFPNKPIRLICPWPAGGATDAVMRVIAESAGKILGGTVLVENKPGASGMLGPNELVKAAPDGYTLSQLTIGVARLPHMQKMQFDPLKDFTYIACMTGYTFGIVVRSDSPIKSIKDMVDFAKANPEKFTYGSSGLGWHQDDPHSVQGRCRRRAGAARRACDVAQRFDRMGTSGRRGQSEATCDLWQQARQALSKRAYVDGIGLRHDL
jgi:tripartite-type tricarboxylate transporter receptor subunit TctC